jgi:Na+/proline symporter
MEIKKNNYKNLEKKINSNESLIIIYKRLTPVFMVLFVLTAFFSFYSSILGVETSYLILFKGFLIVLFGVLTMFNISINKKEKENEKIILKLYN